MKPKYTVSLLLALAAWTVIICPAFAWNPLPIANDPLVRMPGTQPDQDVNLWEPLPRIRNSSLKAPPQSHGRQNARTVT